MKKPAAVALLLSFVVSTDASRFRDLVEKVVGRRSGSDADKIAIAAAVAQGSDAAVVEGESNRELATKKWHPKYSAGWTDGYCQLIVDLNSPGYSTELACCKEAYAGQIDGACLGSLPSPPTTSPTDTGGLDFYYPDYAKGWDEAYCINTRPMPNGRPTYKTMILCCKGAYAGQFSGKCFSMLPSPPTSSPTNSAYETDFWYPQYELPWGEAGCSNKLPLPYNNINDRINYKTQIECCKGAYAGQTGGKCLSQLPNPPTTAPTGAGGLDVYYPNYDVNYADGTCTNTGPMPNGRPTYPTMILCCKGSYLGQISGTCLSSLPSPPTTSPTDAGGVDGYYPNMDNNYAEGKCINDSPLPADRPVSPTKTACCTANYGSQFGKACACDALGPCHSCDCSQTDRDAVGCALDCS